MCKSPTANAVQTSLLFPTPRSGDSAKKRRLTEDEALALSKEFAALDFPDSPYSSYDPCSPLGSPESLSDVPTSPISPVRRRSSGSVTTIAEPCGHAQRLREEEQDVVQAACGQRREFVRAKRTQPSRETPKAPPSPVLPSLGGLSLGLSLAVQEETLGPASNPCKYSLAASIGEGGAGTVRRGVERTTGRHVAIKTLKKGVEYVAEVEAAAMRACASHPNALQLLDTFTCTNGETHLVSELATGDLLEHLQSSGPVSEDQARQHCRGLLSALSTLHEAGFCHRDVKLENCLLSTEGALLLCDMGTAARCTYQSRLSDAVGSHSYMSPEVVAAHNFGSTYDGTACDVHSTGIVFYAMVAGSFPFELASPDCAQYTQLSQGAHPWPSHFSKELSEVLQMMIGGAEGQRPTCEDLLSHRYFLEETAC